MFCREANATVFDKKQLNQTVHLGKPLKEAIWRTNNGFVKDQVKPNRLNSNTQERYFTLIQHLEGKKMTVMDAVNITAILGDKGTHGFFSCANAHYVLSVTYQPLEAIMYVAYEHGTLSQWTPACCSVHVKLDISLFFKREQINQ